MTTSLPSLSRRRIINVCLASIMTLGIAMSATAVTAQESDLDTRGAALVDRFMTILGQPDDQKRAALGDFLADEYQIVRANGTHMDKAEYVADPASVVKVDISDVRATEAGDVLVVSHTLSVSETLDGVEQATVAPRLSVFHGDRDGTWQISAHANFGALSDAR